MPAMTACYCTGACRNGGKCPNGGDGRYTTGANQDGLPIIPPLKRPPPRPTAPDGAVAICGECGIRIYPVMGYACGRMNCPVFPKATF